MQQFLESKVASLFPLYLAVPFTTLSELSSLAKTHPRCFIGAQNMHEATKGAYTGEISGAMLREAGASFVLLGHSERRQLFGESEQSIAAKLSRAVAEKLSPILCIGETLEENEKGEREEILRRQLLGSLANQKVQALSSLIVAYEPVWAIGSGKVPKEEEVEQIHTFCYSLLSEWGGEEWAENIPILYGGSVTKENAAGFLRQSHVNGLLVGTASLEIEHLTEILSIAKEFVAP